MAEDCHHRTTDLQARLTHGGEIQSGTGTNEHALIPHGLHMLQIIGTAWPKTASQQSHRKIDLHRQLTH